MRRLTINNFTDAELLQAIKDWSERKDEAKRVYGWLLEEWKRRCDNEEDVIYYTDRGKTRPPDNID